MKFQKRDALILIIPVLIMFALTPILPEKIPMQWGAGGQVNWYLDRSLAFLLGLLPIVVYKLYQLKHKQ